MKKLTSILVSAVLSIAAGQAFAQTAAASSPAASVKAPSAATAPRMPAVKDFKAARDLELERTKFSLAQLDKAYKCVEASKTAAELMSCHSNYRDAVSSKLAQLIAEGKYDAAYEKMPAQQDVPAAFKK
ncbi:hypothetical protein WJ96_04230 [Burkholderia ubonensis]|uniref:Uncharacterized protein n=1 Tax=Burkholderia ubonensis TaxID=101571 RepID=A0AAW3MV27_9BURK|nr:hypothetical protein [Burkholderia ubonensis]KVP65582.1 hypothetical protein WJ93_23975 [Burkholderia ubonensis]KVP97783.1 hypothetical protein WJ96_04230 [Burkholderia ubonensis]KVZ92480.1 hypothetical protein WL25_15885 [Burkholderia ubonensis]